MAAIEIGQSDGCAPRENRWARELVALNAEAEFVLAHLSDPSARAEITDKLGAIHAKAASLLGASG